MENRKKNPPAWSRRGVMEALVRRRDPSGDLVFDPDAPLPEEEDGPVSEQ